MIDTVKSAVSQTPFATPLRVFTLGIGESTSTAMCEGIARAGNGLCLMAAISEGIIGKCSKLVRASRTYILRNITIDWGTSDGLHAQGVWQAPAQILSIYPGTRLIVFYMVEDEAFLPPKEVVIRAQRDGFGEVLQFAVPVQCVEFPSNNSRARLIPVLAARRAIEDIEDNHSEYTEQDLKTRIVRLGTQSQLVSGCTSFVAVDRRTGEELPEQLPDIPAPVCQGLRFTDTRAPYNPPVSMAAARCRSTAVIENAPQGVEDNVLHLIRLQSFNGSFQPSSAFHGIIGEAVLQEAQSLGVSEEVWATVLAVVFLKKHMRHQQELLDSLVEKAEGFLSAVGVDCKELLARAQRFVA